MQHFRNPWVVLVFLVVVLILRQWEILLVLLGAEIVSQSLHEDRHHSGALFAGFVPKIIGVALVLAGSLCLKFL